MDDQGVIILYNNTQVAKNTFSHSEMEHVELHAYFLRQVV